MAKRKPGDDRVAVFEALARDAFQEKGFHEVSLRDLVQRAGLTNLPSPYRNKAGVFEAMTGRPAPATGRARVLEGAAVVFKADGYFRTTLNRVADVSGASHMTVLRFYPDKAVLWAEAMNAPVPEGAPAKGWSGSRAVFAEETRARVVEVARRQFQTQSFDAVSIRGVAKAARLSTGAVMGHYSSKADLWRAAMNCEPPGDSVLYRRGPELLAALKALLREAPVEPSPAAVESWRAARDLVAEIEEAEGAS